MTTGKTWGQSLKVAFSWFFHVHLQRLDLEITISHRQKMGERFFSRTDSIICFVLGIRIFSVNSFYYVNSESNLFLFTFLCEKKNIFSLCCLCFERVAEGYNIHFPTMRQVFRSLHSRFLRKVTYRPRKAIPAENHTHGFTCSQTVGGRVSTKVTSYRDRWFKRIGCVQNVDSTSLCALFKGSFTLFVV